MTVPSSAPGAGPASTSTAARFAALRGEQRVRLLRRLVEADRLGEIPAVVPPRDEGGPVPLSLAQEDLWVFESLYPGTAALNLCCAYHFDRPVAAADLERALTIVRKQHDILRTRIAGDVGDLRLELLPADRFVLERVDLRDHGTTLSEELAAFSRRPFDLTRDELMRGCLVTVDDTRSSLVLALHHIVTDWWSFDVLHGEFVEAYRAVRAGVAPRRGRPRIQYADFASWQRELEAAGVFDAQLRFWRERLADPPEPLTVGGNAAVVPATGSEIRQIPFHVDAGTEATLRAFARERGATAYGVLMTAFAVLAYRLSGRADFVIGTPTANRSATGLDRVIGYVMNALPTRWRIGPTDSFADLLGGFTTGFPRMLANAEVPVGRIVSAVGAQRTHGRSPLFQWVFMHLNRQESVRALREIAEPERVHTGGEHDLVGITRDTEDGIEGTFEIRTDVYPAEVVRSWAESFPVLLAGLLAEPEVPVGAVALLGGDERRRLRTAGDGDRLDLPPASIADLAARRAAETPDAVAVESDDLSLTYAELLDRADRLAGRLREHGVGAESVVALALGRTVATVVAVLAVQRAGGAYLPIDLDYPADRIRLLFDDAAPVLVVTDAEAALPETGVPRLVLGPADLAGEPAGAAARTVPAAAGYLMYTSGSTGRPKGVVVTHSGIASLAEALVRRFELTPQSRVLHLSSPSFDISVGELCMAFGSGGTLVIPQSGPLVGAALGDVLRERRVTCVLLPPAVLASVPPAEYPELRTVCVGADVCPPELVAAWASPGRRFHNAYGPTETTVGVTVSEPLTPGGGAPPIGRPITNTTVHVLDARLRPVPVGVPGELYLAGEGLARGYLGQPAATAERFVADPYARRPGARMYRSGDLVRWRADGQLDFLGRTDGQLKLRGFRVEPAEIEAVLAKHASVARAVVLLREDTPGDRRLVAYLVPRPGAQIRPDAVLAHALAALPVQMVPSAFVPLETLPTTAHGKLDRAALPAPVSQPKPSSARPGNATEEVLCGLFAELLGVPQVGVDDGFFELGGDSIMALLLVSRARAAGLELTLREVFTARTPAGLAVLARAGVVAAAPQWSGPGRFPLTPVMSWWCEHGTEPAAFALSVHFPVPAAPDAWRIDEALRILTDRHDALRLRLLRPAPDDRALEVSPPGSAPPGAVVRVDAAAMTESERAMAIQEAAARTRLAPEAGDLLAAVWFDHGPGQDGRLLLTVHHLAVDAVSLHILHREMIELLTADRPAESVLAGPAPGTSMRRWAELLHARADEVADDLPRWTDVLTGPDSRLLPDRVTTGRRATLTVSLPAAETEPVLSQIPAAFRCGTEDVLLTALLAAVVRWRGRGTGLLLDREAHGRDAPVDGVDLAGTVGWFTTRYPVRLDAPAAATEAFWRGGADTGTALKEVKEQLRAVPAGGLDYGLLRYVNPETASTLAKLPEPDVGFNYLGRFESTAGGVELLGVVCAEALPLTRALDVDAVTRVGPDGPYLATTWSYAIGTLGETDVRELVEHWRSALRVLADHASTAGAGGVTRSDFPLVDLSQEQLDALVDDLDAPGRGGSW
ncbi:amino acid adenylation domain-containing protein [Micromonospora orduensis]|uniref:Amino acid adenylation domain-containing protein n=1 Tax=Micromonospora orduensis TaxID=1420891 RepID=A0A5C4QS49_9ACTN|nr:non-ribosomal peptide synthetase [Micromonospora orduensis]TNH28047.1 amino acid adenylation domain-containing protein [Micromonospora orduensis]